MIVSKVAYYLVASWGAKPLPASWLFKDPVPSPSFTLEKPVIWKDHFRVRPPPPPIIKPPDYPSMH